MLALNDEGSASSQGSCHRIDEHLTPTWMLAFMKEEPEPASGLAAPEPLPCFQRRTGASSDASACASIPAFASADN